MIGLVFLIIIAVIIANLVVGGLSVVGGALLDPPITQAQADAAYQRALEWAKREIAAGRLNPRDDDD
jgi:hypothetical protein